MEIKKSRLKNDLFHLVTIVFVSVVIAIGLHVFVYKADFAPSGIDGLATILQYVSETFFGNKINAGVFTLLLNLPLLIAAWFLLNKRYVVYTIVYTVVISVSLMLLARFQFPQYDCTVPGTYNSHIVAAIFGGVMQGVTGVLLRIGGSSGGADVVGCLLHKRFPHKDVETMIAYVSYAVVAIAFVVYGNLNSVCLSVIEIFVCEKVTAVILKTNRSAVKLEIITEKPCAEELKSYLMLELGHGTTLLKAEGGFSGAEKEMILCLINYRQIPLLLKRIKTMPGTFLYYSDVKGVRGNFEFGLEDKETLENKI